MNRWWMNPSGEIYDLKNKSHPDWAVQYLSDGGQYNHHDVMNTMFKMGWVRLRLLGKEELKYMEDPSSTSSILVYDNERHKPTSKQMKSIKDFAIENGIQMIYDDNTGEWEKIDEIIKKSELKILIKEILNEWRGMTSGEWVEPNGTVHELGHTQDMSDHHYDWAEKYLRIHGPNRFKDDPRDELISRGWARVIYSDQDKLIMIMVGHRQSSYLTRAQRKYLEDQSEETGWKIADDNGYDLYIPFDCKTPDCGEETGWIHEDHGLGYSHNVSFDITKKERDPLNDPLLTGKKPFTETSLGDRTVKEGDYTFKIFSSDAKGDGFDYPIDVNYGTIYLGELRAMPDGYVVRKIDTPSKERYVSYTGLPPYKSMLTAARTLHMIWSAYRKN